MSTFAIPASALAESVAVPHQCNATIDQKIRCELGAGHEPADLHRNGPLTWHEPLLVFVGGELVDTTRESERWRNGRVLLFGDAQ